MNDLPPLNGLRAFDAAGRHLSFRAAADDLGVTQGAVAQQVRALEAQLGLALFERLPKGLALTSAGRAYHPRVAAAFPDLRDATATLRRDPGKVLVSVTPTFAAKWLIPNLPRFSAAHPEIELQILATEKITSFHSDGIDLAVRQGPPPSGAALDVTRLFRQDIIAVCAPTLAGTVPLAPEALLRLPKLHDAHDLWPPFLRAMGLEQDRSDFPGLRLNQTTLAIDAALAGQGAALVSRFLVARELASGALVDVAGRTWAGPQDFHLVALRGSRRNPAIDSAFRWFVSAAQDAAPGP
ncbi:LysR substrate-binding domain-containing protein [Rhodalgimonas zhirmunskyi]|uniref:LysR substrate-binding domain-containing protein n=1 Tax=Rhodalgimonas zhirmunskyi TaxID=2964767 RepID=A0AAJ1X546_9RHOB|nr:LysR substrate-binding domain-containing protein [Rhodoalgimonas zhirmunskyi]MDQ2094898.1 LysR substrate-binding domain-containing protein [Rhodoalgimonas zhirmunskyi]